MGGVHPSTFRIVFSLENNSINLGGENQKLRPLARPWAFFRRMRILAGGQIIEDINQYNRVRELMHMLTSTASRDNDGAESFGPSRDTANGPNPTQWPGMNVSDAQVCMFKPLSGLINQGKFLPIRYMPLVIELEFVDNFADLVMNQTCIGTVHGTFDDSNTSLNWSIINAEIKVDLCTLDNALDNSYAQHLLSGKSLPINYSIWVSQCQTVTTGKMAVNVARALTRLKSVFVTFIKDGQQV